MNAPIEVEADLEFSAGYAPAEQPRPGEKFGMAGRIVDVSFDPGYQRGTIQMKVQYMLRDPDGEILAELYDELESIQALERYELRVRKDKQRGFLHQVQAWQAQAMPPGAIASLQVPVIKGVTS